MPPEHTPDGAAPSTTGAASTSDGAPDHVTDGDGTPVPAERSRAGRSFGSKRNQAPSNSAKGSQSARSSERVRGQGATPIPPEPEPLRDLEDSPAEPEPRRLALEPWALARFALYAVLIVLVASLAGYLVGGLGGTVRAARSEVLYQLDAERPTGFLRQDRQLTTQLVTIRSRSVLEPVAAENGLTFEGLSDKLDVGVAEESEVIRIDVRDGSASRAKKLVDGITRGYLARVPPNGATDARQYLENQLAQLDQRQQQLSVRLAELRPTTPPSGEQAQVTAEMQSLFSQRVQLEDRLEDVTVDELRRPRVEQITKGYVLADPVSPRPWQAAVTGALAGLVVAVIAIAVLVRRRLSAPRG